jgi:dihydrofolate reductase
MQIEYVDLKKKLDTMHDKLMEAFNTTDINTVKNVNATDIEKTISVARESLNEKKKKLEAKEVSIIGGEQTVRLHSEEINRLREKIVEIELDFSLRARKAVGVDGYFPSPKT